MITKKEFHADQAGLQTPINKSSLPLLSSWGQTSFLIYNIAPRRRPDSMVTAGHQIQASRRVFKPDYSPPFSNR